MCGTAHHQQSLPSSSAACCDRTTTDKNLEDIKQSYKGAYHAAIAAALALPSKAVESMARLVGPSLRASCEAAHKSVATVSKMLQAPLPGHKSSATLEVWPCASQCTWRRGVAGIVGHTFMGWKVHRIWEKCQRQAIQTIKWGR